MRLPSRRALLGSAVLAAAASFGAGGSPAFADRCEPTEPVVRVVLPTYEEPTAEADSPFCYVMLNYVYPRVCDNPSTLLGTCIRTINPDLQEPVVIAPYQPVPGRIFCNYNNFVYRTLNQPSSCTY